MKTQDGKSSSNLVFDFWNPNKERIVEQIQAPKGKAGTQDLPGLLHDVRENVSDE